MFVDRNQEKHKTPSGVICIVFRRPPNMVRAILGADMSSRSAGFCWFVLLFYRHFTPYGVEPV